VDEDTEITLEETVEVQDRLIHKYERQIKSLEQKISSLGTENKELTEKLEEYKATIEDKEAENAITVESQEENINRMNAKINQLMNELEMKDEKIQQLENDIKDVTENVLSKEKQVGALEERINYLSQDLNEKKEENLKIQEEFKEIQTENIRLSNEIARVLGNLEGTKNKMVLDETKVNELQAEVFNLNDSIKAKDSEIEELKSLNADNITKIADLEKALKDFSDIYAATKEQQELNISTIKGHDNIVNYIKEQLPKTNSRLFIIAPSIMDLKPIVEDLPTISPRIQIRIATHINPEINQHNEILTHLKKIGDVTLRNYIKEDRWCIERDSAEILLAHGGIDPVGIILQDPNLITLVRNFITEPWITSR